MKKQAPSKKTVTFSITERNLVAAYKQGLITWFQYLELFRKIR
jgi:hypothetical protein